jgi:hypothetical protein
MQREKAAVAGSPFSFKPLYPEYQVGRVMLPTFFCDFGW